MQTDHDPMPDHRDDDLNKSVLDLELELERLEKPARLGGLSCDYQAGGRERVQKLRNLIAWMHKHSLERIERLDPTEEARIRHARNIEREFEPDHLSAEADKERAASVAAMIKREDKRQKKGKAA